MSFPFFRLRDRLTVKGFGKELSGWIAWRISQGDPVDLVLDEVKVIILNAIEDERQKFLQEQALEVKWLAACAPKKNDVDEKRVA